MPDLPCAECGGQCCTYVPMLIHEYKRIRRIHGVPKGARAIKIGAGRSGPARVVLATTRDGTRCPWLVGGRCSVYDDRPQTCREYGTVPWMPCMYLYPEAARARADQIMAEAKASLEQSHA